MFRNGWDNNVKDSEVLFYLEVGFVFRIFDVSGNDIVIMLMVFLKEEDVLNEEFC